LGYKFFREKKFNGKRLVFLIYEQYRSIFLITLTDKKIQEQEINLIKANLDIYKEEIETKIRDINDS
ncbi:MAG: hypothetical protein RL557_405, partial [archaeon]